MFFIIKKHIRRIKKRTKRVFKFYFPPGSRKKKTFMPSPPPLELHKITQKKFSCVILIKSITSSNIFFINQIEHYIVIKKCVILCNFV